ncbi:hypothetical protein FHX15_000491 [Rhizobium sp. BK650]|nr:hypothetical protein [Rhizobium sp. BK650]
MAYMIEFTADAPRSDHVNELVLPRKIRLRNCRMATSAQVDFRRLRTIKSRQPPVRHAPGNSVSTEGCS